MKRRRALASAFFIFWGGPQVGVNLQPGRREESANKAGDFFYLCVKDPAPWGVATVPMTKRYTQIA